METKEFIHPQLNDEVHSFSSHYVFQKEARLPYNGREILYYTGYSVTDNTCCGAGGSHFSYVPGFIVNWQKKKSDKGEYISEIELILDKDLMIDISRLLKQKELCTQVDFL